VASVGRDHGGEEGLDGPEVGQDVDAHGARDVFVAEFGDELAGHDAGVVDEDVHLAHLGLDLGGDVAHVFVIPDVAVVGPRLSAGLLDFLGCKRQWTSVVYERKNCNKEEGKRGDEPTFCAALVLMSQMTSLHPFLARIKLI
jgi:hypothetical protein